MVRHYCTGVAGFISSNLARRLCEDKNNHVVGVDSLVCGFMENIGDLLDKPNFEFRKEDIRSISADKETYDYLWHFAARGEVYVCANNPEVAVDVNVVGTLNTLKFAKETNVDHFFFADTSAEYDSLTDPMYFPTSELMAPNINTPMGFYPITKMAASQFVRSYGKKNHFGTTLFRYTNVYGPSMNLERDIPPVVGAFTNNILFKREKAVIYGDGEKRRDFLHIDDLTTFHMKALEVRGKTSDTETYNAGYGMNWSINDIHSFVYDACAEIDNTVSHEIDYRPDQLDEAQITLANIDKAIKELGWAPTVYIKDGIKDTVEQLLVKHLQRSDKKSVSYRKRF
jgi:UDP-N-acetylglucosamine/UDP-N-acetylgalactosamine 4-epimerase